MNRLVALAALLAATPLGAQAPGIALVGGRIYPVSGPKIEKGTILLKGGTIVAVGANVAVPAGYTTIDVTGKWVTPGLLHGAGGVGTGVGNDAATSNDAGDTDGEHTAVQGTSDDRKQGDVNAAFSVVDGIDPWAINIPVARLGGVTTSLTLPGGQFIAGRGPWIDLAGTRVDDMVVKGKDVLLINLSTASRVAGGGSRAAAVQRLRLIFRDALALELKKLDYEKAALRPLAAPAEELRALLPFLKGMQPVVITANRAADIQTVVALKKEFGLNVVLQGGVEAWVEAKSLAAAGIPVMISATADIPSFDGVRARLDNAALLREAGVKVIVAGNDPGGAANLRYSAGQAVRHGLSWDDGLRAVTLEPALAFGLTGYGALAAGKVANVVVWDGDPLDFVGAAEHVFIRGVEVPRTSRMTELRDRYKTLPPRY